MLKIQAEWVLPFDQMGNYEIKYIEMIKKRELISIISNKLIEENIIPIEMTETSLEFKFQTHFWIFKDSDLSKLADNLPPEIFAVVVDSLKKISEHE